MFLESLRKKFEPLLPLFEVFLVMPVSTAVCERGFSTMKQIKSDWRASLSTESLQRLMFLSMEGPSVLEAEEVVDQWWSGGKRAKRPGFSGWADDLEVGDEEEEEDKWFLFLEEEVLELPDEEIQEN